MVCFLCKIVLCYYLNICSGWFNLLLLSWYSYMYSFLFGLKYNLKFNYVILVILNSNYLIFVGFFLVFKGKKWFIYMILNVIYI